MAIPIVAIVGRPNVGKSTLFNRLAGGRVAIVEDTPGVTRDRIYRDTEWLGRQFTLVDTGGIDPASLGDSITAQMRRQAEIAIHEADLVLLIVDGRAGVVPDDEAVAEILRRSAKPVILVVNKVEQYDDLSPVYEFFRLGLGDPVPISAAHGMNTGDLLDRVVANLPETTEKTEPDDAIKIAVVGRPNVGKSSLVNAFLGQQRVIVSDVPGTTRDAIDTWLTRDEQTYILIDTAGMRRKGRIEIPTERYSVIRSLRAVDRSDVVLVVLDAVEGITEQDKKIAGYAHEAGKAAVIVVNKWDLLEKDEKTMLRYEEELRRELAFMQYAPIMFVSALTRQRIAKLLEQVDVVAEQAALRVSTGSLNTVLVEAINLNPPPTDKGKRLKILYTTQAGVKPPTFILFVNDPELMHFSYLRYLENRLRQAYGFVGTPVKLITRKRGSKE
ncbi:GTP-binding protein Der [Clostridiales bacterium PH28_bin88]|nr:GTP-binding protein Der [Clostridiales bacterium PH28_bin88]